MAGVEGLVNEGPPLHELSLPPEEQQIFFEGLRMDDTHTLGHYQLVHNERLYLEFRWPWQEEEPEAPAKGEKKEKGGGKKKK